MDIEKLRGALAAAPTDGEPDNHLLRGKTLAEAEVTRFQVVPELAARIAEDVRGHVARVVDKELLAYDPAYQSNQAQVLVEPLADVPELARVDDLIRRGGPALDQGGSPLVAMAHRLGGEDGIVAYRLKGPGIGLRRRGWVLAPTAGVYREVGAEVLEYDGRFDAVTVDGAVLFSNVSLLATRLQAPDKAKRTAERTWHDVAGALVIEGGEALAAAVLEDPTMRAKVASIARLVEQHPEHKDRITTTALVAFAKEHPTYGIPLATTATGETVLRFETSPQQRFKILHLLADDYLYSHLTAQHYEAGSKQVVQRP